MAEFLEELYTDVTEQSINEMKAGVRVVWGVCMSWGGEGGG